MTACVNCARALQPAWKYCIFCGTRTAVAASAPRSRPLPSPAGGTVSGSGGTRRASAPARTSVPAFSNSSTAQTPVVQASAPAPLSAAPTVPPVSSEWPKTMGERPSLRSALAATEVPAPTPPAAPIPAPEDEEVLELKAVAADLEVEALPEPEPEPEPIAESEPPRRRPRGPRRRPAASGTLVEDAPIVAEPIAEAPVAEPATAPPAKKTTPKKKVTAEVVPDVEIEEADLALDDLATRVDRTGRINLLAVLALLLGVLASPLAALFGHVALTQLRASGERGVIPAWIAIVLGYLWLGFFIVLGITYLATNG
jgi:hypothetical protein